MVKVKKVIIALFSCIVGVLLFSSSLLAQSYKGNIGKYKVLMELHTADGNSYTGKYRYANKQDWIQLNGSVKGAKLYLNESVNGSITGKFELVKEQYSWSGLWRRTTNTPPLVVQLMATEANETVAPATELTSQLPSTTGQPAIDMAAPVITKATTITNPVVPSKAAAEDSDTNPKNSTITSAAKGITGIYKLSAVSLAATDPSSDLPFATIEITVLSNEKVHFDLQYNSGSPLYATLFKVGEAKSNDGGKAYRFTNGLKEKECIISIINLGNKIQVSTAANCSSNGGVLADGVYERTQ